MSLLRQVHVYRLEGSVVADDSRDSRKRNRRCGTQGHDRWIYRLDTIDRIWRTVVGPSELRVTSSWERGRRKTAVVRGELRATDPHIHSHEAASARQLVVRSQRVHRADRIYRPLSRPSDLECRRILFRDNSASTRRNNDDARPGNCWKAHGSRLSGHYQRIAVNEVKDDEVSMIVQNGAARSVVCNRCNVPRTTDDNPGLPSLALRMDRRSAQQQNDQ